MNNYTNKFDTGLQTKLKEFFTADGAEILSQQYAFWRAKNSSYTAIFYNTGKFLIQGADVSSIAGRVEKFLNIKSSGHDSAEKNVPAKRIGVDESGKGDFFGPLVVAGVVVDESNTELFIKSGVKDCKMVDDKNINKNTISPKKLSEKIKNISAINAIFTRIHNQHKQRAKKISDISGKKRI